MSTQSRSRENGSWRCRGLGLFLLSASVLAGCQKGASTKTPPVTSPQADVAVQPSTPQPAVEAQKPVELQVIVLAPKITVEKPVLDFGEVGTDTKNSGKFEFINAGNAPLKIIQVHSCCGVATRVVEAGEEFAPGERGTLEFDYSTGSAPLVEPVALDLRLQTNDPEQSVVTFAIKAKLVRRVGFEPERLRLFLRRENAGCGDITIRSLDGKPFSISSFRSTADTLSAEFDPNVKATEFVLKPRSDMEKLSQNVRGLVSINLTHPECSNLRLPFDVLPEFTINPAHLIVWDLRPGQPLRREILVIGNYQDDFEVESVSSQKGLVKLLDKNKTDGRCQLQIEITAPVPQGEKAMVTDKIEVKIKDNETVSIPFQGIYVAE